MSAASHAATRPMQRMTVRDVLARASLRTQLLAGERGLDRPVSWAHVFEFPDPHEWLARDELVMTSGLSLPAGARAQRAYVDQVHAAGAAGLVILRHHRGPPMTNEVLSRADDLGFPLLEAASPASFPMISQAIAEAGSDDAERALSATEQIYNALRDATVANESGGRLIAEVAAAHQCTAAVLCRDTGRVLLCDPRRPVPPSVVAEAATALRVERRVPANALRVGDGLQRGLVVSLALAGGAVLLVGYEASHHPDPIVMSHLATIATAEHERLLVGRAQEQDHGADVLARAMDGTKPEEIVAAELADRGIARAFFVVAMEPHPDDPDLRKLYFALAEAGITALTHIEPDRCYVLLPFSASTTAELISLAGDAAHIGISAPFEDAGLIVQAAQQALWTLNLARASGRHVVRHIDDRLAAFVPETLDDARGVVDGILGPLIAHDATKGVELLTSLRTFLAENRSWQRAAAKLYVHKQTLVYRMRKVEELTHLRLDSTEDVAQLWLALRTHDMLGGQARARPVDDAPPVGVPEGAVCRSYDHTSASRQGCGFD